MNEQEQRLKEALEGSNITRIVSKKGEEKVRITVKRQGGKFYLAKVETQTSSGNWRSRQLCKLSSSERYCSTVREVSELIDRTMADLDGIEKKYVQKARKRQSGGRKGGPFGTQVEEMYEGDMLYGHSLTKPTRTRAKPTTNTNTMAIGSESTPPSPLALNIHDTAEEGKYIITADHKSLDIDPDSIHKIDLNLELDE